MDPCAALADRLRPLGLDLTASGSRASIAALDPEAAATLPEVGRDDAMVVIVGNGRALWAPLRAALRQDPVLFASLDPVDDYTRRAVNGAAAAVADDLGVAHATRHAAEGPPVGIAAQRLAVATGLAAQSPSHLSVHPELGPWLALRAAVVFDFPGTPAAPRLRPCGGCAAPCMAAFDVAIASLEAVSVGQGASSGAIEADPAPWIAIRDACPEGADHRYDADQLAYHYRKDVAALRALARG